MYEARQRRAKDGSSFTPPPAITSHNMGTRAGGGRHCVRRLVWPEALAKNGRYAFLGAGCSQGQGCASSLHSETSSAATPVRSVRCVCNSQMSVRASALLLHQMPEGTLGRPQASVPMQVRGIRRTREEDVRICDTTDTIRQNHFSETAGIAVAKTWPPRGVCENMATSHHKSAGGATLRFP